MTWFNPSCEDHQRRWLLRMDGTAPPVAGRGAVGWLKRRANDRHLTACQACRDFVDAAGALTRRMAGVGEVDPPEGLLRAIGRQAAELPGIQKPPDAEQLSLRLDAEQRWWAGAFMGGAVLAAAAGLVLAVLRPGAFSGYAAAPSKLEARLAWAQEELDQFAAEPPDEPGRDSLDDRIHSIEKQLRCLEIDLDEVNWNTLKQDTSCIDS